MAQFKCRGPLPDGVGARIAELIESGEVDEAQRIDQVNRGLKVANLSGMVNIEGLDDKGEVVTSEVKAKAGPGCGADLDAVIFGVEEDGIERTRACPKCGNRFKFVRMVADEAEEE